MQVFDASSMIYAWDNYPVRQMPGLWEWMADQIAKNHLLMPSVAFDEVAHKVPECSEWLRENNLELLEVSNAVLQEAMRIKHLLGIVGDKYGSGVGENDLLIIGTAMVHQAELVTDEAWQPIPPRKLENCKIPAVCVMDGVSVRWIKFIDYIKRSDAVFR
jgi:predicted nucleic acid-binding protein